MPGVSTKTRSLTARAQAPPPAPPVACPSPTSSPPTTAPNANDPTQTRRHPAPPATQRTATLPTSAKTSPEGAEGPCCGGPLLQLDHEAAAPRCSPEAAPTASVAQVLWSQSPPPFALRAWAGQSAAAAHAAQALRSLIHGQHSALLAPEAERSARYARAFTRWPARSAPTAASCASSSCPIDPNSAAQSRAPRPRGRGCGIWRPQPRCPWPVDMTNSPQSSIEASSTRVSAMRTRSTST